MNDGADWRSLLSAGAAPWSLRDVEIPFRWRDAPELEAIVIDLRQNLGTITYPIDRFLEEVTAAIRERQPRNVVLDVRLNGGGKLQTTRDFARALPGLVAGRVFVLTSPWTFSAAISTVGYLKQSAPQKVTIVGESVGDRMQFWAEGQPVVLTHTGIVLGRALERHDYSGGCRTFTDCHWAVSQFPIEVPSLAPDIVAPWTIADYRAGRDPGMDAIASALRTGKARERESFALAGVKQP